MFKKRIAVLLSLALLLLPSLALANPEPARVYTFAGSGGSTCRCTRHGRTNGPSRMLLLESILNNVRIEAIKVNGKRIWFQFMKWWESIMNVRKLQLLSLCLLLLFSLCLPTLVEVKAASKTAILKEVKGKVMVKRGGGKKEIKAFEGMGVTIGIVYALVRKLDTVLNLNFQSHAL